MIIVTHHNGQRMVRTIKLVWTPVFVLILGSPFKVIMLRSLETRPWHWLKVLQKFINMFLLCTPV